MKAFLLLCVGRSNLDFFGSFCSKSFFYFIFNSSIYSFNSCISLFLASSRFPRRCCCCSSPGVCAPQRTPRSGLNVDRCKYLLLNFILIFFLNNITISIQILFKNININILSNSTEIPF